MRIRILLQNIWKLDYPTLKSSIVRWITKMSPLRNTRMSKRYGTSFKSKISRNLLVSTIKMTYSSWYAQNDEAKTRIVDWLWHGSDDWERNSGGISQCSNRYANANNKYMVKKYDESKESVFLAYLDENNLHGWAMSNCLPHGGFKWSNTLTFWIFLIPQRDIFGSGRWVSERTSWPAFRFSSSTRESKLAETFKYFVW